MKAIKLASVFAVSAVAAAVSTATFAAEAVFTGNAGVEYVTQNESKKTTTANELSGTKEFEVEVSVDTGIVYAEIEIATDGADEGTKIGMEKLYVKQGAVKFGRFDGTVATGSFFGMDEYFGGVDLKNATDSDGDLTGDTDNTGIRYMVSPELTVAIEATNAVGDVDGEIGFAASYVMDFGGFKAGISGGAVGDANAVNVGVQTVAGPATVSLNYGSGAGGTDGDTDIELMTASVAFAASEALTLTLEFSSDLEAETDGTYFVGEYAAGDLTYYVKNYAGDLGSELTKVGVKASF
ncbi:hypothetical protein [Marinomonas profundimaris]|uniref:Porin n=1 Tax=Marinomonas profundimaris TaxID=1208321 RepID=W1RNR7_9GAMM|nr:hypothetical protein [Marinomonas profundimaris]ETI58102.1 hypothetical protein D104_16200 [Marinomonas profundimaris]